MRQPRSNPKQKRATQRETWHVFDRTIKYLLYETNPANTVSLINALFERRYAYDSPVSFAKTESTRKHGKTVGLFHADAMVSVADDRFAIEFQTSDSRIIGLRIFEYGFMNALGRKRVSDDGGLIEMDLPDACVVYFESSGTTPGEITFRLTNKAGGESFDYRVRVFKMEEQSLESLERQRLLLLLPFWLMRFRRELERVKAKAEDRRAIAQKEMRTLDELEDILVRARDNGFLGTDDGIMIMESISQMHEELYGSYPEFQEVSMAVDKRIKLRWAPFKRKLIKDTWAEASAKTMAETESRIIGLFKQGHTVEEVEKLLAREKAVQAADASGDTPK